MKEVDEVDHQNELHLEAIQRLATDVLQMCYTVLHLPQYSYPTSNCKGKEQTEHAKA